MPRGSPVRADAGPLYEYTAMPVQGLNRWHPRELYDRMEMGRYLGHTYNMPLYRIPAQGQVPRHREGEEPCTGRHQLFDLREDPRQEQPLDDPELEADFVRRIDGHLRRCGAQPEQWARLGIPKS